MLKVSRFFKGDPTLWIVFFFLCLVSLIEVFSAASTLSYKAGSYWDPLLKQAVFLSIGTLVVIMFHNIPCRWFKIAPPVMLPLSVILLAVTMFAGSTLNGANRWMNIFGISFQPSEIAKGTLVITVALILSLMQTEKGAAKNAFKYILIVTGVICGLIVTENLSTAALLFGVVVLMMFIGRVPMIQLGKLFGSIAIFAAVIATTIFCLPDDKQSSVYELPLMHRLGTWKNRISSFTEDKEISPQEFDLDKDAQVGNAKIAIATCNYVGKMPGNSEARDFLSQAFSDFIFAIIIEEIGLWGSGAVIFFYVIILFRAGRIASRCESNFPAFLAMGLALLLVSQALLNMMVAVGLFPVTGQPLPFISRGGTSTLINCAYIGIILSVSRYASKSAAPKEAVTVEENTEFVKD